MEKITFPGLITYLRDAFPDYNQLYYEQEMKSWAIDKIFVSKWIVQVIEPIVIYATKEDLNCLPSVFSALYTELLLLAGGKKLLLTYEKEYHDGWLICKNIPHLIAKHPQRVLKAINSALLTLREYQPERVEAWISLMNKTSVYCKTLDDFLNCGRVAAWICGMAHLRRSISKIYAELPLEIRKTLNEESLAILPGEALTFPWGNSSSTEFINVSGGFYGFGGPFTAPPVVAEMGEHIIATDAKTSCALFADCYGMVLMRDAPFVPERVLENAGKTSLKKFREKDLASIAAFDDITSCVVKNWCFVLTRSSSHYLFIYSCLNAG